MEQLELEPALSWAASVTDSGFNCCASVPASRGFFLVLLNRPLGFLFGPFSGCKHSNSSTPTLIL